MIDGVLRLADLLRRNDVDVSASEVVDAVGALGTIDVTDRRLVRTVLRACLVKQPDENVFERCFRQAFGRGGGGDDDVTIDQGRAQFGQLAAIATSPQDVSGAVLDALIGDDDTTLGALAARAVELFAGLADAEGTERYFVQRVLKAIDLSKMLSAAMQRLRAPGDLDELELMLRRTELNERLAQFRRMLADEIASRLEGRGSCLAELEPPAVRPEDLDLTALSRADHARVRRALQPMIRRLATRIGRRRRRRTTGRPDVRRTLRRSLQSGGVPIDVVHRRRHPHRPDLVVLCDVSGSVAEFAQFTFTLVSALHAELASARSFAFVDGVAEVTDVFGAADHELAVRRLVERRAVVGLDGHSDYGRVFADFAADRLHDVVGPRTSVIVCGDARGNYRDDQVASFAAICRKARRVYWLNPEPRHDWGRDDSLIDVYAPWCRAVYEVRTLAQLEDALAELV